MSRKVIFLDIDGTLTEAGKNVPSESALMAVRKAQEKGNLVFLCTGRNYDMLRPLLSYGFDGLVASAGGYVVCHDQVIFDCPMTALEQERANAVLKAHGIFRTIECKNGSYTDDDFKYFLRDHAAEGGNSELLRWREQIEAELSIRSMTEYDGEAIYKIVLMCPDKQSLFEAKEELGAGFHFVIQPSDGYGIANGEMQTNKFDKGTGVKRVCDYLGIPVSDSYGFGDSMNDLEMIEVTGTSVCMENGFQELKDIADYVCPAVSEDGLYKAFEKLGLM